MPRNRAVRVFFVAIGLIALILIAGIVSISALRWRAKIVYYKAAGQISEVECVGEAREFLEIPHPSTITH